MKTIDYLEIEGRLFRQFLSKAEAGFWTAERCAQDPPLITTEVKIALTPNFSTLMTAWKFRGSNMVSTPAERQRARKFDPQAYACAAGRIQTISADSLCLVDGVLFQETRSPGWIIGMRGLFVPGVVDDDDPCPSVVVDPRYSARDVRRVYPDLPPPDYKFRIYDPSRLPDTIEVDALACLAVSLYRDLSDRKLGYYEPRFIAEVLRFLETADHALEYGEPLDACYEIIERIADWRKGGRRDDQYHEANFAYLFMTAQRELPPQMPVNLDYADADDISASFRP